MWGIRRLVLLLAVSLVGAACSDDSTEPDDDDEPEVATLRLAVGAQTINVNVQSGVVTGGPILLATNTTTPVTATFLRADGSLEPLITNATFRLDVTPANTNIVTFTRTGPFSGTLRGVAAGSTSVDFSLFHLEEGHSELNRPVSVTVQQVVSQ